MGYDAVTHNLLDPFGGQDHLVAGILRHVSDKFAEDPLCPPRVAKLARRFGFQIHPNTVDLCRSRRNPRLSASAPNWWASSNRHPRTALHALGLIHVFSEVAALRAEEQDIGWHPEGDVFIHTPSHVVGQEALSKDGTPLVEIPSRVSDTDDGSGDLATINEGATARSSGARRESRPRWATIVGEHFDDGQDRRVH